MRVSCIRECHGEYNLILYEYRVGTHRNQSNTTLRQQTFDVCVKMLGDCIETMLLLTICF